MEVGQLNNLKIGYIIQARMKSHRLPGKVLMPIPFPNGKSLLFYIVNQLKSLPGETIVATSKNPENDLIVDHGRKHHFAVFRGDEQNVYSRFSEIIRTHKFDHIVRLTADNPILDVEILIDSLTKHIEGGQDYTYTSGLPLGMNMEFIKSSALIESERYIHKKEDEEHVTLAIKRTDIFKKSLLSIEVDDRSLSTLRLTVDTEIDYALINLLIAYGEYNQLFGLRLINSFKKTYSQLLDLNKSLPQKNSAISYDQELNNAIELLSGLDYNRVIEDLMRE